MAVNHTIITGPNIRPTAAVPLRCTRNSTTMITAVIGTTNSCIPDHAAAAVEHAAGPAGGRGAVGAGHLRCVTVLRRQHDHSGDLGAVGGGGAEGGPAVAHHVLLLGH